LLGALVQVEVASRAARRPIDLAAVEKYLAERDQRRPAEIRDIAAATARFFALKLGDLRSATRRRPVVMARNVAIYLARRLTNLSLQEIGRYFGDRDHTTVMHGCRAIEKTMKSDPAIRRAVHDLETKFQ
jgi:chromosomal replication initiator protein